MRRSLDDLGVRARGHYDRSDRSRDHYHCMGMIHGASRDRNCLVPSWGRPRTNLRWGSLVCAGRSGVRRMRSFTVDRSDMQRTANTTMSTKAKLQLKTIVWKWRWR